MRIIIRVWTALPTEVDSHTKAGFLTHGSLAISILPVSGGSFEHVAVYSSGGCRGLSPHSLLACSCTFMLHYSFLPLIAHENFHDRRTFIIRGFHWNVKKRAVYFIVRTYAKTACACPAGFTARNSLFRVNPSVNTKVERSVPFTGFPYIFFSTTV